MLFSRSVALKTFPFSSRNLSHQTIKRGTNRASLTELFNTHSSSSSSSLVNSEICIHGKPQFKVTHVHDAVEEFGVTMVVMEHLSTKLTYVHFDTEDTNNAFCVAFRTPESKSYGVQHILEHTVLCGSEKYPVRDPFFNMLKRSLNTFMNAMTGTDYTLYPFSTQNPKDFSNLLGVYLDATFFPLLRENDFRQEGHRLEFSGNTLQRTGVVYNEMKGHLSDSTAIFETRVLEKLFSKESIYGNNSGGNPSVIPDLTYENLIQFHKKTYHPSNSIMISYGDLPVTEHLQAVHDLALSRFTFSQRSYDVQNVFKHEASFIKNRSKILKNESNETIQVIHGPPDAMGNPEKQIKFLQTRILDNVPGTDSFEKLVWQLLSPLLLNGPTAPMHKALIDSGLAPDYSPLTGIDFGSMVPSFGIGCQGIDKASIPQVEDLINKVLIDTANEGFDKQRVEGVLHQIELNWKHKRSNFGLTMVQNALHAWIHVPDSKAGDTIIETFKFNEKLRKILAETKENPKKFWGERIQNHLLNEPAQLRVVMEPASDYEDKVLENEKSELNTIQSRLSEEDVKRINEDNQSLAKEREGPQNVACLPTLLVQDIPKLRPDPIIVKNDVYGKTSISRVMKQNTNGIVYSRFFFDTSHVSDHLKPLLPLMCSLLGNIHAGNRDHVQLALDTDLVCGGHSISFSPSPWFGDKASTTGLISNGGLRPYLMYREGISVSQYAFEKNLTKSLDVLSDILLESKFDADLSRLHTLIASSSHGMITSLTQDPISQARLLAQSPYGRMFTTRESLGGLSRIEFMMALSQMSDFSSISSTLKELAHAVFSTSHPSISVVSNDNASTKSLVDDELVRFASKFGNSSSSLSSTAEADFRDALPSALVSSLNKLEELSSKRLPLMKNDNTAIYMPLPIPVHYNLVTILTNVDLFDPDSAALSVLAQISSSNFLHREIREKGGAYGSSASHDSGMFSMTSWFDPNTEETLKAYQNSLKWLCEGGFSDRDVDEALLALFGDIDKPQAPANKGLGEFMYGVTNEMRQSNRERYLSLNRSNLVETANRYLSVAADEGFLNSSKSPKLVKTVVIAGSEQLASKFKSYPGWEVKEVRHHSE